MHDPGAIRSVSTAKIEREKLLLRGQIASLEKPKRGRPKGTRKSDRSRRRIGLTWKLFRKKNPNLSAPAAADRFVRHRENAELLAELGFAVAKKPDSKGRNISIVLNGIAREGEKGVKAERGATWRVIRSVGLAAHLARRGRCLVTDGTGLLLQAAEEAALLNEINNPG